MTIYHHVARVDGNGVIYGDVFNVGNNTKKLRKMFEGMSDLRIVSILRCPECHSQKIVSLIGGIWCCASTDHECGTGIMFNTPDYIRMYPRWRWRSGV